MKKLSLIVVFVLLLSGCSFNSIEEIKKLKINGCTNETFEESINKYIKDASWEKDGTKYIIKGKNRDDKDVVINAIIKGDNVEIEKVVVDKVNITDKPDDYMPKLCSSFIKVSEVDGAKNEENNNSDNPKEEIKPAQKPSVSLPVISENKNEQKKEVPKEEIKVDPPKVSDKPTIKNTAAGCAIDLTEEDTNLVTSFRIYMQAQNDIVTNMSEVIITDTGIELDFELMDAVREEFFYVKGVNGLTKGIVQDGITKVKMNLSLNLNELNKNSSEDMKIVKDYFGEFDYNNPTLDSIISYFENGQFTCVKSS